MQHVRSVQRYIYPEAHNRGAVWQDQLTNPALRLLARQQANDEIHILLPKAMTGEDPVVAN
jgi:hypothetical protein